MLFLGASWVRKLLMFILIILKARTFEYYTLFVENKICGYDEVKRYINFNIRYRDFLYVRPAKIQISLCIRGLIRIIIVRMCGQRSL